MKGVVLGGGLGKRMLPLTLIDNKHLLPVYNKRMIEYPLGTLVKAGIDEIILITGGNKPGTFLELLKDGAGIGAKQLYYTYQSGSGGIPDALKLARPFFNHNTDTYFKCKTLQETCCVILGDNYFETSITPAVRSWTEDCQSTGACILIQPTTTPWDYGIAQLDPRTGKILSIQEKPQDADENSYAILGCYMFDDTVWSFLDTLQPSVRGELEIVDVLKWYLEKDQLAYYKYKGKWSDMGVYDRWMEISNRVSKKVKK